jgi:hypothetical protein
VVSSVLATDASPGFLPAPFRDLDGDPLASAATNARRQHMASITTPNLTTEIDVANVTVSVSYDIQWSAFDQASQLSYLERVELFGDDTQVVGSAEDGVDDRIPSGVLVSQLVSSDGSPTLQRPPFTRTIPLANLNEDLGILGVNLNPDEIRARVTLTPRLPSVVTRESNQVTFNLV